MFKLLAKTYRLLTRLILLAAILAGCRLFAFHAAWPAWSAFLLAGGIAAGHLALRRAIRALGAFIDEKNLAARNTDITGAASPSPETEARLRATWNGGLRHLARRRGGFWKKRPTLPWYVSMGTDNRRRKKVIELADISCSAPGIWETDAEFSWHFGDAATWLDVDFPLKRDDGGRWERFLAALQDHRGEYPLGGVLLTLDAKRLLAWDKEDIANTASCLKYRLDRLVKRTGAEVPCYILINRIDVLYGMRTLVSQLPSDVLSRPLGGFRKAEEENAAAFVEQTLRRIAMSLSATGRKKRRRARTKAAAIQAPRELMRLNKPLMHLCGLMFGASSGRAASMLRGVFFGSTGPRGETVPCLLSSLESFRHEDEKADSSTPWFWTDLLRQWIPRDPGPTGATSRRAKGTGVFHPILAGLLAGTLILCWSMTMSFVESRRILLSASQAIAHPETPEILEPLLNLGIKTSRQNEDWWLPRFGMDEAEHIGVEMRKRYCESYFSLKTVPEIDRLQNLAINAAATDNPAEIGNALILLMTMRQGLSRCLDRKDNSPEDTRFLHSLVDALGLARSDETRQLDMYLEWAGPQEWMKPTRDKLVEFENYLLSKAMSGDVMRWLPGWIRTIPGMQTADASAIWAPASLPESAAAGLVVDSAWTGPAYATARRLLNCAAGGDTAAPGWSKRRDDILKSYRDHVLAAWQGVTDALWDSGSPYIEDADLPVFIRQAGNGEDPALRLAALLDRHLLAVYSDDELHPDIEWLRNYAGLLRRAESAGEDDSGNLFDKIAGAVSHAADALSPEENANLPTGMADIGAMPEDAALRKSWLDFLKANREVALVAEGFDLGLELVRHQYRKANSMNGSSRSFSPPETAANRTSSVHSFDNGKNAANALERQMFSHSGGTRWKAISPSASYRFLRRLVVRHAAVSLDAAWREQVYYPSSLVAGTANDRMRGLLRSGGMLERFLADSALGLWQIREGKLSNANWDGLDFMFNRKFLSYCNQALAAGAAEPSDSVALSFRARTVNVDPTARERPHTVEFYWEEGGREQTFAFRNYAADHTFSWKRDKSASAGIRVHFPALTLHKRFSGNTALADFINRFQDGTCVLDREEFPEEQDALRRLGVSRLVIRAEIPERERFLDAYAEAAMELPESIITGGGGKKVMIPVIIGHAADRE